MTERWSRVRRDAFSQNAETLGATFSDIITSPNTPWTEQQKALSHWISALPKPCGVMACNDVIGLRVLDVCRLLGTRVPEEVAVVGVDNDELLCELADPPMSSVDQDVERIGREAASLLDRMMAGKPFSEAPRFIEPKGVVRRASSDVVAIEDPALARALRLLRSRPGERIPVADLARSAALSRRELERRFRSALGRSPAQEVTRCRLAHARSLLGETDEPLERVAERSGFRYQPHFSAWFKKHHGETPGAYRSRVQTVQT